MTEPTTSPTLSTHVRTTASRLKLAARELVEVARFAVGAAAISAGVSDLFAEQQSHTSVIRSTAVGAALGYWHIPHLAAFLTVSEHRRDFRSEFWRSLRSVRTPGNIQRRNAMIGGGTGLFLIATAFLSGANISRTAAIMTIACGSTYGVLHEVVEKTRNKLERPRPTEETLMTAFNADETTATTPTTSTASPASSREGSIAPVSEDLTRGDGGSDIGAQRSDDTTDESEEEEVLTMLTTTSSRW